MEHFTFEEAFSKEIAMYSKPGLALKGARHKKSLTQIALAKRLNIRQENLSKMENGKRPISILMAKSLAKVLGVDYRVFL